MHAKPCSVSLISRARRFGGSALLFAVLVTGGACTSGTMADGPEPDPEPEMTEPDVTPPGDLATSTRNDLIWRRYRSFEQGLGEALNLAPGEACTELGRYDCIDQVHLVALGGNDPINAGMHEPMKSPTATTPVAVERLTLSACDAAVTGDAARAVPLIFLELDLSAAAAPLDLDDETTALAVDDTITSLYRRLHGRNPLDTERATVKKIITEDSDPLAPREFALLACFAIASTSEAVFQ